MRAQFAFQEVISVQQSLLQAQTNAQQGLKHALVLDLAKAYEKVDKEKLLHAISQWLEDDALNTVRATLDSLRVRTTADPTDYFVGITRGWTNGRHRHLYILTYTLIPFFL